MGSIISPPQPSPPPPPPAPEPASDPEEERRTARLDMLRRRQRGRAGTIATSPRGLLRLRDELPLGGKQHLGD